MRNISLTLFVAFIVRCDSGGSSDKSNEQVKDKDFGEVCTFANDDMYDIESDCRKPFYCSDFKKCVDGINGEVICKDSEYPVCQCCHDNAGCVHDKEQWDNDETTCVLE